MWPYSVVPRNRRRFASIVYKPLPQDDPVQRQPDISLASRCLDWSPKVGLDEGLKQTVAYFEERLNKAT